MRLLILSFSYTPRPNPRAIRWTILAEHFARAGHSVDVVTSWQPGLAAKESIRGVHLHRVGNGLLERLRFRLEMNRADGMRSRSGEKGRATKARHIAANAAMAINRALWRKLWWPDSACVWVWPALTEARALLAIAPIDVVISVSPPFSSALVGYILAGTKNRRFHWLVDLGDPFSFLEQAPANNFGLYRGVNRRLERRIFCRADTVSVTTEATREIYAGLYPGNSEKITAIPPLLPRHNGTTSAPATPVFTNENAVRLVYVGTLYRNLRKPDFLLALFHSLTQARPAAPWKLHFIGDTHECSESFSAFRAPLAGRLFIHAPVDPRRAAQAMLEADILINLGNDTAFQLPSKLVEYAATGKRILSISRSKMDSSAAFLRTYPNALCLRDEGGAPSQQQVSALISFCEENPCIMGESARDAFLRPYQLDAIASAYLRLFGRADRNV